MWFPLEGVVLVRFELAVVYVGEGNLLVVFLQSLSVYVVYYTSSRTGRGEGAR